jgi:hypothetical protein
MDTHWPWQCVMLIHEGMSLQHIVEASGNYFMLSNQYRTQPETRCALQGHISGQSEIRRHLDLVYPAGLLLSSRSAIIIPVRDQLERIMYKNVYDVKARTERKILVHYPCWSSCDRWPEWWEIDKKAKDLYICRGCKKEYSGDEIFLIKLRDFYV